MYTLALVINPHIGKWFLSSTTIDDPSYTCYMVKNNTWACILSHEINDYDPEDSY